MKQLALGSLGAAFLDCAWAMFSDKESTDKTKTSSNDFLIGCLFILVAMSTPRMYLCNPCHVKYQPLNLFTCSSIRHETHILELWPKAIFNEITHQHR
jgi:hypothetical protein